MKKRNVFVMINVLLSLFLLVSCEKMEDMHSPYLEGGELIYTSKVDSLIAFAGRNRVQLNYLIVSDPKITNSWIYWNNGNDSISVPIQRSNGIDRISATIPDLEEGTYTFNVYTNDTDNNRSIRSEVIANVYGETYANSISNRPLDNAFYYINTNNVRLNWFGVAQQAVIVEVEYTDVDGVHTITKIDKVIIDPRKPAVFLPESYISKVKAGTSMRYRTGYLPEVSAIDTFYTGYFEIVDFESKFQLPDYFKITARHSNKSLMVENGATNNGGKIIQYPFNNSAESIWKLTENTDGYTVITNINSNRDMSVQSASVDDGATILQWSQGSNTNDEWTLEPVDDAMEYFQIINRKSDKVMEISEGSLEDGAGLVQNTWNEGHNQQFKIEVITASAPPNAPGELTAIALSTSEVQLNWVDNSDNEYFNRIERSADGIEWSPIATVSSNLISYRNSGLPASTTYHYRVLAGNTAGNSDYSNSVEVRTLDISVGIGVTETETLILADFQIENNYNGEDAVVKPISKDVIGSMRGTFAGETGVYDVSIRAFDENDGQATITLKVNGTTHGSVTLDADDNAWHTMSFGTIPLGNGDEIAFEASQNSGEHCRMDKVLVE